MSSENRNPNLRLEAHPSYSVPCTRTDLVAALGKRRAKAVQQLYPAPMTRADLILERAIDEGHLMLLDGAWGPKRLPVDVAANFGLRLTDQVVSNGATRGIITQQEAEDVYVTIGRPYKSWAHICTPDTLRGHHQRRVFVLSEHPELFDLDTLWEIGYSEGDLSLGKGPDAFDIRTTAEIAARQIAAPFTDEQVEALRHWQQYDEPVRCKQDVCAATDPPALDVSKEGLICPTCGTTRSWAWRVMTEVA
ncbi:hypothetical protein [Streptomyces sp. LN500]|uniref:hypothetical protein n=1 Tax=Streptomyces sp. LN500 TaxID=3112978 RepID=UPI003720973B